MRKNKPDYTVSEEDRALFRSHVADIHPLSNDKHPLRSSTTKQTVAASLSTPSPNFTDSNARPIEAEEILFFAKSGLPTKLIRQLRQGNIALGATLDLHGMTTRQASEQLHEFIDQCQQRNKRFALIIHGKGNRNAEGKSALKTHVNHWLRQDNRVLAFCSAKPKHGGAGALYVLLKLL